MNTPMRKYRKSVLFLTLLVQFLLVNSVFVYGWLRLYPQATFYSGGNYLVVFSGLLLSYLFLSLYGGFQVGVLRLAELIYSNCLALAMADFLMYIQLSLIARALLNPLYMAGIFVAQCVTCLFCCRLANSLYFSIYPVRNVLLVCRSIDEARDLTHKINSIRERYRVVDTIDQTATEEEILRRAQPQSAILLYDIDSSLRDKLLNFCYEQDKRLYLVPKASDIIFYNAYQTQVFDTPVFYCKNRGLTAEQAILKRTMDICIAGVGLVAFAPIMLLVALAIKLGDGGPVLYRQERITQDGRRFKLLKFRSMVVHAEKRGEARLATQNDDRITPVGKVIRKLRLDELPQLLNILLGEMSVVGPRPERQVYIANFTAELPEFAYRLKVKAGLTGYAQVYGRYNTTPQDKLNMDLLYIENYSLLLDIKIILLTIKILFMSSSTQGITEQDSRSQATLPTKQSPPPEAKHQ